MALKKPFFEKINSVWPRKWRIEYLNSGDFTRFGLTTSDSALMSGTFQGPCAPLRDRKVMSNTAKIAIIMGSRSDWPTMEHAAEILETLKIEFDAQVVSAHRTPERLYDFAKGAKAAGVHVIIAGAGGAAHLPGMVAALTPLPVLGVPVESKALSGMDSLLSIAQMPGGVPVGTLAIGKSGAKNAALLAASILALNDPALAARLDDWRREQTQSVARSPQG